MDSPILSPLSAIDRIAAKEAARDAIKASFGTEPQFPDYQHKSIGRFPQWFTWIIAAFCVLALSAAFYLSAMNLNSIGVETVGQTHSNGVATAGIAFVLLAESAVVVFSLAFAIVDDRRSKALLLTGMAMATTIALVGNIEFAEPSQPFQWIGAIFPPVIVLILSFVLKTQALYSITQRHEQKRLWQAALDEYQKNTRNPDDNPAWRNAYANALRDAILAKNRKGRGKRARVEILQAMTSDEWRVMVGQELQNDDWFQEAPTVITAAVLTPVQPQEVAAQGHNGNGRSVPLAIARGGKQGTGRNG